MHTIKIVTRQTNRYNIENQTTIKKLANAFLCHNKRRATNHTQIAAHSHVPQHTHHDSISNNGKAMFELFTVAVGNQIKRNKISVLYIHPTCPSGGPNPILKRANLIQPSLANWPANKGSRGTRVAVLQLSQRNRRQTARANTIS